MFLQGTLPLAASLWAAMLITPQAPAQSPTPSPAPSAVPATATSIQQAPEAAPQPFPTGQGTPLGAAIDSLLHEPTAARAHWGIAITQLDGTPVYGLEEGKLFRPASTAKLFTTAAAMALLGPDARFTTGIYGKLNVTTGTVKGDLILVGGGDPSFGTTDLATEASAASITSNPNKLGSTGLNDLVAQLLAKGVHSITGNVVGDDELFAQEQPPEGWAAEDLTWGYGALPSALSFADNQLHLTIKPQPGTGTSASNKANTASPQLDQLVPFLHLSNNVAIEPSAPGARDHVDVQPVPGHPRELTVLGTLSPGASPISEHVALDDPAQYAAESLRFTLTQRAVRISGKATAVHLIPATPQPFLQTLRTPDDCATSAAHGTPCELDCERTAQPDQLLAQHTSAPLAADVKFTLKTSANLHAEMFLRQLDAKLTCGRGASSLGGARILRAWLLQAGLIDHDFLLYDGSGLSTKDLVTPRAEAKLLAYAATQPWYTAWKAALPLAGVDGTLANRFTTSPLKAKVFAKTGTLGETHALAGYVQCASGHELVFSILEDNHDPSDNGDRQTAEKILEAVAAAN